MRVVGLRELKNRLSEYVRQVRAGEIVLVTDRGEVVADANSPDHYPAMPAALRSVTVAALLDAERGDR